MNHAPDFPSETLFSCCHRHLSLIHLSNKYLRVRSVMANRRHRKIRLKIKRIQCLVSPFAVTFLDNAPQKRCLTVLARRMPFFEVTARVTANFRFLPVYPSVHQIVTPQGDSNDSNFSKIPVRARTREGGGDIQHNSSHHSPQF